MEKNLSNNSATTKNYQRGPKISNGLGILKHAVKLSRGKLSVRNGDKRPREQQYKSFPQETVLAMQAGRSFAQKDWALTEKLLKRIIASSEKTSAEFWAMLSASLRNQKKYAEATATIQDSLKEFNNNLILLIEEAECASVDKNWSRSVQLWEALLKRPEISPQQREKIYTSFMHDLVKADSTNKALNVSREAHSAYKDSLKIDMATSRIYMALKDWGTASKMWIEIIDKYNDIPVGGWVDAISTYRYAKQFDKAETGAKKASDLYDDIRLRIEWAEIPTAAKEWEIALERWRRLDEDLGDCSWVEENQKLHIKFNLSVVKRIVNIGDYLDQINNYINSESTRKIAIVTSFTDNYDTLKLPEVLDDRFDYFVYTNKAIEGFGVYKVRPFSYVGKDAGRTIRYVKTHPHILFPDYDIVIWIDTSILINGDIYPLIDKFIKSGEPIASTPHQHRSNIHEEVEACIQRKKDDPSVMLAQIQRYTKAGFDGNTLAENGILMFSIGNKKLSATLETWWQEILNGSKRDQLSFGYSLFKEKSSWHHIVDAPFNMRNMPGAILTPHHTKNEVLDELHKLIKKAQNV